MRYRYSMSLRLVRRIFIAAMVVGLISIPAIFVTSKANAARASRGKPDPKAVYGRIQYVTAFPDVKVKVVRSFADLRVQVVKAFANSPGEWEIVDSFPDFKVEVVESFEDFTIEYVNAFPGVRD